MPTIEDGAEFCLEDTEAWNALVLSRGCIIEALLPNGVLGEEVDVWGGFLVMESRLNSADSSWLLDVKSLGCSSPEVPRELSGFSTENQDVFTFAPILSALWIPTECCTCSACALTV